MSEPPQRNCATMDLHFNIVRTNPDYVARRLLTERRMLAYRRTPRVARPVITIPMVVHVVYKTQEQNISDAQIKSQIKVLNEDFRALNKDKSKVPRPFKKLLGDPKLNFSLAVRDPFGRPTTGITRTRTDVEWFSPRNEYRNQGVKFGSTGGVDAWPSDRYLNIWICNLGDGLLGYSSLPDFPPQLDGVVIGYKYFGTVGTATSPYNKGRTATHEIGHWLNLLHIWGDDRQPSCLDTDEVEDTPNQEGPNKGKPTFPTISCSNGPHGDMFMNYMDYTDDEAMFMFTKGQCERMYATLDGPRAAIQNSDALKKATRKSALVRSGLTARRRGGAAEQQLFFNGVEWVKNVIQ